MQPPSIWDRLFSPAPEKCTECERLHAELKQVKQQLAECDMQIQLQTGSISLLQGHNQMLVKEARELRGLLDDAQRQVKRLRELVSPEMGEMESLKTDIDNFKIWTKKLDWSTANIPDELRKYFKLEEALGVPITTKYGVPVLAFGTLVDDQWHGFVKFIEQETNDAHSGLLVQGQEHGVWHISKTGAQSGYLNLMYWMGEQLQYNLQKNENFSSMYLCADLSSDGVSVQVLTNDKPTEAVFPLKNGYMISLFEHKGEIRVWTITNSEVSSAKWYQLKK